METRGGSGAKDLLEQGPLEKDVSLDLMAVLTDTHELFVQGRVSLDRYIRTIERHARILKALSSSEPGSDNLTSSEADPSGWDVPPLGPWQFHNGSLRTQAPVLKHLAAARKSFNSHARPNGDRPPPMGEIVRASKQMTHSLLRDVEDQLRQGMVSHKTYLQMRSRLSMGRPRNGWGPEVEVALVSPPSASCIG